MKLPPTWEKVTHSGRHHAILFIDTVFNGYQKGVIGDFSQINFNPTHYRQFDGARWWLKEEINTYIFMLKNKEKDNPGFLLEKAKEYEALNEVFFGWSERYATTKWKELQIMHLLEIFEEFVLRLSKINALVYTASMLDRFYTDEITQIVMKREPNFEKQKYYFDIIFSIYWGLESHFERESLLFLMKNIKKNGITKETEQMIKIHMEHFKHLYLLAFYRLRYDQEKVLSDVNKIIDGGIEKEKNILTKLRLNSEKVKKVMKDIKLNEEEKLKIETLRKWTFIANNDDHYGHCSVF